MNPRGRTGGPAGAPHAAAAAPGRPRVLLVDDDGSTRRFVAMALEELEIDLACACDVPEAMAALRAAGPVDLLLTDLMMPGETGIDLLQHLAASPALRGDARLAVLSARHDSATDEQLAGLGLWRRLHKPVSVAELQACVRDAVRALPSEPSRQDDGAAAQAPGCATAPALTAAERDAVDRHFGGELTLFMAFRSTCLLQFADDVRAGDAAVGRGDAPALRRLAHNLKSVFATLGIDALRGVAVPLESAAAASDWNAARPLWDGLRAGLSRMASQPPRTPLP